MWNISQGVTFVKAMLNTSNQTLLIQGTDNLELRSEIKEIVLNMAVILTLINSNKKVNIAESKEFCQETYLLVTPIRWTEFSSSAHIVLTHSPELIEENDNTSLLNFIEFGIDTNNKFLRQYCINYARKISQFENLSDCINRLRDKSWPNGDESLRTFKAVAPILGSHTRHADVETKPAYKHVRTTTGNQEENSNSVSALFLQILFCFFRLT